MQANSYSPYALKDMYQSIDLIDRKIASSVSWEIFESQDAREAQLRKLSTKRAALVKSALALTNLGVECDARFLPRSFMQATEEQASPVEADSNTTDEAVVKQPARTRRKRG